MGVISKNGYFNAINKILTKTNWGKILKQAQTIIILTDKVLTDSLSYKKETSWDIFLKMLKQ